jgi:predicted alpha/beta-hydrolase family hydrolase
MFSRKNLDIRGYQGESVANTFLRQNEATEHAAIVFPGLGYTCQGPVLHYPTFELVARGADVLKVEDNTRRSETHNEEVEDALAACQILLQQRLYKRLTIIGKSLGTMVMGNLLATQEFPLQIQTIWLTPILPLPALQEQLHKIAHPSLFVIGTADFYYKPDLLKNIQEATGGEVLVIEGADHGLLIQNDVLASIHVMERVIQNIQTFLDQQK